MISPLMRQRLPKLLRLPLFLLSLAVFLNGASTPAHAAFSGSGNGSADNPYIITTPAQLNEVRNNRSACYKLGNDIDMSAFGNFVPIGLESGGYPFTGTFDGDYRTTTTRPTSSAGTTGSPGKGACSATSYPAPSTTS